MIPPFQVGDRVRLTTGKSLIIVTEIAWFEENPPNYAKSSWNTRYRRNKNKDASWYIRYSYRSSLNYNEDGKWRETEDFIFYEDQPKEKEVMTKPSLYQTKETPVRYGTFLIKNSEDQLVLEMKGEGGAVESFDEKDVEVVTPYTVEFTALGKQGHSCHIIAKKGDLKKDDVLLELDTGTIYRVTKPDSKCLSPRGNKSKWMKIPAEFFTFGGESK